MEPDRGLCWNALTSRKGTDQACLGTTFSWLVRSPWLGSGGGAWCKHRETSNIEAPTRKEGNNNVGWGGGGMVGKGVSSHSALPLRCCSSYRGGRAGVGRLGVSGTPRWTGYNCQPSAGLWGLRLGGRAGGERKATRNREWGGKDPKGAPSSRKLFLAGRPHVCLPPEPITACS